MKYLLWRNILILFLLLEIEESSAFYGIRRSTIFRYKSILAIMVSQIAALPTINQGNLNFTANQKDPDPVFQSQPSSLNVKHVKMNSKGRIFRDPIKSNMVLAPLLYDLTVQEELLRQKRSLYKDNKATSIYGMRNKLRQLMSNITSTLNDMDWYFSPEQYGNKAAVTSGFIQNKKKRKKYEIKKMYSVDEKTTDNLIDSFIQQMYKINPSVLNKIRYCIDKEFSSVKRQVRLANIPLNANNKKVHINGNTSELKTVTPDINELDREDELLSEPVSYEDEDFNYENNDYSDLEFEDSSVPGFESETNDAMRAMIFLTTSTTVSTTTSEAFYDYGDYYKESYGNVRDLSEYDINQNDEEPSAASSIFPDTDNIQKLLSKMKIDHDKRKVTTHHKNNAFGF